MTRRVAVAATGEASRDAGLGVVEAGGNAVDAAIAAALVAMSTEPGVVSLMGGAFVNVWAAGGTPEVIDGNVEMPGRGLDPARFGQGVREVRTDYGGGVTMFAGPGSVANSGAVQALSTARDRHGALSWGRLVAPAAEACRSGYRMGGAAALYLSIVRESLFGADPEAHALVTGDDGHTLRPGEYAYNPALAEVLDELGRQGEALFRTGEIGQRLAEQMAAHGGLITPLDLESYAVVVREPVIREIGEWQIALNPPPSVGGPMLAVMLGELAREGEWNWATVIEVQRRVLRYRAQVHDHSRDLEADGHALLNTVERYGLKGLPTSASTAHVSAVDSEGLACAITMSAGYGAGIVIPGTGMLLNNALGEPELNRLGLHAVSPGTRLASNMAPTTGHAPGGRSLAIGSPGADRITTALMQVIGQGCLHKMDVKESIDAPRVHVRVAADGATQVDYEADPGISLAVEASGLPSHEYPDPHMYFGGVGAAYLGNDGQLGAAGDNRREAAVGVSD